jgi:hypothetical protein
MTATPLGTTQRYFPVGTRQWYYVPTIADPSAPKRAELDAGTDLSGEIVDGSISGFELSGATLDVPDTGDTFTGTIRGRVTAAASALALYVDEFTSARTLFAEGDKGFIVIFPEGDHAPVVGPPAQNFVMDVWPVEVLDTKLDESTSVAGQITVDFSHPKRPNLNVAVPIT